MRKGIWAIPSRLAGMQISVIFTIVTLAIQFAIEMIAGAAVRCPAAVGRYLS